MQLSKNFSLDEMCKSLVADKYKIDNTPDETVIRNLNCLVQNILQPLRDSLNQAVTVSSGYRCKELNYMIGSKPSSDHIKGFAADIEIKSMTTKDLFSYIRNNFKFTQLILEFYTEGQDHSGWCHVSYNPENLKNECLIAVKESGKTIYKKV